MEIKYQILIGLLILGIIIPIVLATSGTDDGPPDVNDTSLGVNESLLVTGHWYGQGGGGAWSGDIWLNDDGIRIDSDGSDADFYCDHVTITLCECTGGCTEDDVNCDVTATNCGNQHDVDIEFHLIASGNNEGLPSQNIFRIEGTTGAYDADSSTVTIQGAGVNCDVTSDTTWTNEDATCSGGLNVSNGATLNMENSNLTTPFIHLIHDSGNAKLVQDDNSHIELT